MKSIVSSFCLLFLLILTGCNCHQEGSGVVLDKATLAPLSGVSVSIYLSSVHDDTLAQKVFTDENGEFAISHDYCSDYMIQYYKKDYIGSVKSIALGDTIFLESSPGN